MSWIVDTKSKEIPMSTNQIPVYESGKIPESFFSIRRLNDAIATVTDILEQVRERGNEGIRFFAEKFDRVNPATLEVSQEDIRAAEKKLKESKPALYAALIHSRDLAMQFALRQKESFDTFEIEMIPGLITGQKIIPVDRAGVYVPGGRFPLFSSVIMGVIPARAAGVDSVVFCSPPALHPSGDINRPYCDEQILAAASLCGVDRVFAVGGAQAIGAMAYGTQSIPAVNVIVGPGNKYVAAAKRLVYGEVGIDLLAGPSEVLIIADGSANPSWIATDMLAQAEHDVDAQAILITRSRELVQAVLSQIEVLTADLDASAPALQSLSRNSAILLVETFDEAVAIANRKAPEHLELALDAGIDRNFLEKELRNFGSLFIGHGAAEILGDYTAGLNHTLPTSGSARFTGGLSVRHFLKTVTTLRTGSGTDDVSGWKTSLAAAEEIALAEGLTFHARAARCRLD